MLGNVRRVEVPEYPTDGVRVRAVELCLGLAREAAVEVIESGENGIDDALVESISIDVKQAHDFPLVEFLLVIAIVLGHLENLLVVDHYDAEMRSVKLPCPGNCLVNTSPSFGVFALRRMRASTFRRTPRLVPSSRRLRPTIAGSR